MSPANRETLQNQWIENSLNQVEILSRFIQKQSQYTQPVLILTRGNSGSGKTWILQNGEIEFLKKLNLTAHFEKHGEDGIINPDTVKTWIQVHDNSSSQEAHEEGSMISKIVISKAIEAQMNMIVDKRFLTLDSILPLVTKAKNNNYRVLVIDVDAPIETSLFRVASRTLGGPSPSVPYDPIEEGFVEARANRLQIAYEPLIDEYRLFSAGQMIAERIGASPITVKKIKEWKNLTHTPQSDKLTTSERLYRSLLDYLSQTLPSNFMRPFDVKISESAQNFENHQPYIQPEQNALEYLFYQVYKTGDATSHEQLGLTVVIFLKRRYPQLNIDTTFVPEQPARTADFRITVTTDDSELLRLLLHDGFWKPVPQVSKSGDVSLNYSTRRIGKRPSSVAYVEYDELRAYLPGEAPLDLGLAAKHFILMGHLTQSLPNPSPDVRIEYTTRIRFSTPFADAHHNSGFHLRQIPAALFAAQVENYLMQKNKGTNEKVCAYTLEANQYIAVALAASQNNPAFRFVGTSDETSKISNWLNEQRTTLQALESTVPCKYENIGK